jgi:RHS repeat-associated protein
MSDAHGTVDLELYNFDGHPVSSGTPGGYKKIARIFATLPDGSRHELRKDDSLHDPAETITGKFLAVDDSRLVFDTTTGTLYLPDGTRMASGFIDKNGNKLVSGGSLYTSWTDTMGRSISSPLDVGTNKVGDDTSAVAFDKSFSVPGFDGGTLSYTMKWKKLEDVLTNPSDTLEYMGDTGNSGTCGSYGVGASPSLFASNGDDTQVMMETHVFDPVVLAEIDLPNGKSYKFTYNIYGEIDKVVYPTGAYDKFAYSAVQPLNPGLYDGDPFFTQTNRGVVSRTQSEDGTIGTEVPWTYGQVARGVTNPDLTYSQIDVYPGTWAGAMKWGFESAIAGLPAEQRTYSSSGTMLTRHIIDRTYDSVSVGGVVATRNPRVTREISVKFEPGDSNALVSLVTYDYDSNSDPAYFADLNPTVVKYYDYAVVSASTAQTATLANLAGYFSSSAPAKQVETDYLYDSNYQARNLTQIPTEVRIKDGSGNVKAKTHFYYDESSYQTTTSGTMPTAASGTWTDPTSELGSTIGSKRALPTTVRSYYDITNGYYLDTHRFYDQYGNVTKVRDGRGNDTTSAFDASYALTLPTSVTTPVPDSSGTYGSNAAFTSSTAYDYSSGLPTSTTDINGQTTTVSYADPSTSVLDPLLRPRVITAPNGQQTITEYGDTSGSLYVKVSSQIDSSNWKVGYNYFDNLGRTIRTRSVDAAGDDYTLACYDNMGRVSKVTNPFRSYSTQTCSTTTGLDWTSTTYDAEGRVTAVTTPDSAQVTTAYALATSGSQIGTAVTVTDQASKVRRSATNALGELIRIDEPTTSGLGTISIPNQATTYAYDTLKNLTGVTQGSQSRSFSYDALSRLTSAGNPESGTVSYTYDNNGNLTQKIDARGVVSSYVYDALNRNTNVTYTNDPNSTPTVNRYYEGWRDGVRQNMPTSLGRLWQTETAGSSGSRTTINTFDALGRPTSESQQFYAAGAFGQAYTILRDYNLAGSVTTETYPSGHIVNYNYDQAGRLADKDTQNLAFTGTLGDGVQKTYASEIVYSPFGAMTKEKFGTDTSIYNKLYYNSRGQLSEIRETTSDAGSSDTTWNRGKFVNWYSLQCGTVNSVDCNAADNNGNLRKQETLVPNNEQNTSSTSWYQQYDYDSLNRLQRVHEYTGNASTDWQQEYVYDRYGNRTINTSTNATWGGVNNQSFEVETATNRLLATGDSTLTGANLPQRKMRYDPAGNLTNDNWSSYGSSTAGTITRTYDAENRMTSAWDSSGGISYYTYNADGQRVRRKNGTVETWQIYGMDGELLAEYPANASPASPQKEYGYRNGQLLITADAPATPRTNFALSSSGATASASSTYSGYNFSAGAAIDGEQKGLNYFNGGAWHGATNTFSQWLQIDFNSSRTVDEIDVFTVQDNYSSPSVPTEPMTFSLYGLTGYDLQYWNGSSWVTVPGASITGNNKVWRKIAFSPLATSKIRVLTNASVDGYSRITEVEAWGTPLPPRSNVAASANGGTATASSNLNTPPWVFTPAGANDGERKGLNWGSGGGWNDTAPGNTFPDWLQVDFNGSKTIDEIDVFTCQDNYANPSEPTETMTFSVYGLTGFEVQYWNGSAWLTVSGGAITGSNKVWKKISFSAVTTTKIRVLSNASIDGYSRIQELEAWGTEATSSAANINWLATDQLGTPRMVFDQTGALANVKRHDYLPFGEELFNGLRTTTPGYGAADSTRQKFTSKERDIETGLDYSLARYYSATQGRFTSVDPENAEAAQDFSDPQSWNGYSYVKNNPCSNTDPDGRCICLGQRLNNFFSGFGPYSNQQLQEKEDYWRQYLRDEQTKYGTLVYNGQTIVNPETISRAEVFHYAASIREAEYYKTIRLYTPEEVDRLRGNSLPSAPQVPLALPTGSFNTVGQNLKNLRDIGSGRLKGFSRGNTELTGGGQAAKETFKQLTGRDPAGSFDRVVQGTREVVYRASSGSGVSKIEIVDKAQKFVEKISFRP